MPELHFRRLYDETVIPVLTYLLTVGYGLKIETQIQTRSHLALEKSKDDKTQSCLFTKQIILSSPLFLFFSPHFSFLTFEKIGNGFNKSADGGVELPLLMQRIKLVVPNVASMVITWRMILKCRFPVSTHPVQQPVDGPGNLNCNTPFSCSSTCPTSSSASDPGTGWPMNHTLKNWYLNSYVYTKTFSIVQTERKKK